MITLNHETGVRHVRFSRTCGASGIGRAGVHRLGPGVGRVEVKPTRQSLSDAELRAVIARFAVRTQHKRFGHIEAEHRHARFEVNDLTAAKSAARASERVSKIQIERSAGRNSQHAAGASSRPSDAVRIGKTKSPAEPAFARG